MIKRLLKKVLLKLTSGRIRYQHFWETVSNVSYEARGLGGGSGDKLKNGETRVIMELIKSLQTTSPVIFDVGANNGEYSYSLLTILAQNNIMPDLYCFEPSESAGRRLRQRLAGSRFRLFNSALGNSQTVARMFSDAEGSDLTSLHNLKISHRPFDERFSFEVSVERLDDILSNNNIQRIDFLKIDAEGHDFYVLEGAAESIAKGMIDTIQFEFGPPNISSRVFFKDFWDLLSDHYEIFRVLPDGLYPIRCYEVGLEVFHTTNYLARRKGLPQISQH